MKCFIVFTSIKLVILQSVDSIGVKNSIDFQTYDFQYIYFIIVVSLVLLVFIYFWIRLLTHTSICLNCVNPALKCLVCIFAPCYAFYMMYRPAISQSNATSVPKQEVVVKVSEKKKEEPKNISSSIKDKIETSIQKKRLVKIVEDSKIVNSRRPPDNLAEDLRSIKINVKQANKDNLKISNIVVEEHPPISSETLKNQTTKKDSTRLLIQNFTETEKSTRTTSTPDVLPVSFIKLNFKSLVKSQIPTDETFKYNSSAYVIGANSKAVSWYFNR